MTAAELQEIRFNIKRAQPLATGIGASVATPKAQSSSYFCMPDGFGPAFGAVPEESGANMVTRDQINWLGMVATYSPFMAKCGALGEETFDPKVATAQKNSQYGIGGYPEGAILTEVSTDSTTGTLIYKKLISLRDDNKFDFTGKFRSSEEVESLYPDVAAEESDTSGDWEYLTLKREKASGQIEVLKIPEITAPRQSTGILGCFQAKYDGALIVSVGTDSSVAGGFTMTDLTPTAGDSGTSAGGSTFVYDSSQMIFNIIVSEGKTSLSDLEGWIPADLENSNLPNGTVIFSSGIIAESCLMTVEKDKWYGIGYGATFCTVTALDMWIKLVRSD